MQNERTRRNRPVRRVNVSKNPTITTLAAPISDGRDVVWIRLSALMRVLFFSCMVNETQVNFRLTLGKALLLLLHLFSWGGEAFHHLPNA